MKINLVNHLPNKMKRKKEKRTDLVFRWDDRVIRIRIESSTNSDIIALIKRAQGASSTSRFVYFSGCIHLVNSASSWILSVVYVTRCLDINHMGNNIKKLV